MMIVFWGLVIAGIIVLVRTLAGRNVFGQSGPDNALGILGRRYAAGEITKEQFKEMRRELR